MSKDVAMGATVNQIKASSQDELFTTETAGLPEVARPAVTRLRDGDRLDLRIGPVRLAAWPVYRWIADHRHLLPGGTAACSLPQAQRDALFGKPS